MLVIFFDKAQNSKILISNCVINYIGLSYMF